MLSLSLLNFVAASLTLGASDVTHTLATTNAQVEFTVGDRGAWISRWEANEAGHRRNWITADTHVPLWTITVQQASGDRATASALDGPASIREASPERLVLAWTGATPGNLDIVVTVSVRGADLVWALEVEAKSTQAALWDITFPEIGPLEKPGEIHSITTAGWGLIHSDLSKRPRIEGTYPSAACSMPFAAVSDGHTGLYLGSEDIEGYPLRVFVGQNKGKTAITLGMRHDVPDMGTAKTFRIPYPLVTTTYAGDWYEAGRIYRKAVEGAPWGRVPPLAQRKDLPSWLINTDLWYLGACHDEASATGVLDFAKFFGVPVSAHVYNWHEIPFDDHYPEYFPAKPGFRDAVAKVQASGVAVMPYINGRLWDAATASWTTANAKNSAALGANRKHYEEVYGSKVPLTPMCPATPLWQETVTKLVDRLFHEVGVQGVYIDQISAAAPQRCFAPNHNHPLGGGTYWIQGYRELLRRCRTVTPPGAALTTEENADPWNDQLDAFLMVNTQPKGGNIVPLYPTVYGGRVVYFGFQYFAGSDFQQRFPLRLKLAQEFTFGSQLGWIGTNILEKSNEIEAEFLRRLCQARHEARDALQFGELLPPVGIECKAQVTWTEDSKEGPQTRTADAVMATAWLTPEGKRKLAVVNIADTDETVTLTLDARHTGDAQANGRLLAGTDQTVELRRNESGQLRGNLGIPARSAFVMPLLMGPGTI